MRMHQSASTCLAGTALLHLLPSTVLTMRIHPSATVFNGINATNAAGMNATNATTEFSSQTVADVVASLEAAKGINMSQASFEAAKEVPAVLISASGPHGTHWDLPHREHHKDADLRHPFWEFDMGAVTKMSVFWCSVALFLSGILCSAAGIGGGGIYVVVLMLVGMLNPHDAIPLSKGVVFFGSLSTLALNLIRMLSPSTDASETVIDFSTVRVVAPATLGGTFLGVLFNWHSDGVAIVLVLASILIFMTVMVSRTAYQQYQAEEEALLKASEPQAQAPQEARAPQENGDASELKKRNAKDEFSRMDFIQSVGLEIIVVLCGALRFHMTTCEQEMHGKGVEGSCQHPVIKMFEGVFMTTLPELLSSPASANLLKSATTLVPLLLCLVLSWKWGAAATTEGWEVKNVAYFQIMAVLTGCFAGLVGVGGGLVFSPFFLVMGLDPAAAVATSSTCVLFTSSSTTSQYMLSDRIIMSLALVYGAVCLVASYAGTKLVHVLQDSFKGRKSYVTFIVVAAVALSAVLSLVKVYSIMSKPVEA